MVKIVETVSKGGAKFRLVCQYLGEFCLSFGSEMLRKGSNVSEEAIRVKVFASMNGNGTQLSPYVIVDHLWQYLPLETLWINDARVGQLQSTDVKVKGLLVLERNLIISDFSGFPFDPGGFITLEDKGGFKRRVMMQS